jgi:hypothetical protein
MDAWGTKIRKAREDKDPWQMVADECEAFFSACDNYLWQQKNRQKFWGTKNKAACSPQFELTIAKAFELVAIFGPVLYWKNPIRTAEPRKPHELNPDVILRMMGVDPHQFASMQQQVAQSQQQAQEQGQQLPMELMQAAMHVQQVEQQLQAQQQQQQDDAVMRSTVADLMKTYLNYTPFELDLHQHAEKAITDALVTGRGTLWSETYRKPGGDRLMVGSFYHSSRYLLIDPDAEESIDNAWWIALELTHPRWYVERRHGYVPGALRKYANMESQEAQAERHRDIDSMGERNRGEANDLITYYRIYSRSGPGLRHMAPDNPQVVGKEVRKKLSQCGDFCYLEYVPGMPFPLNLPPEQFKKMKPEEVAVRLRWPTPHWKDGKWPVTVLDFYPKLHSVWPIAPLGPGLGELKAINLIMSHFCGRVWNTLRDFPVGHSSVKKTLEKALHSGVDLTPIWVEGDIDIDKVVGWLQHPETRLDVQKLLAWLFELFDKRTGLSELVYGMQGKSQERTATGAQIKQQNLQVRPDHMASKVESFMTDVALREALAVRWHIEGQHVVDIFGQLGAQAWDTFIVKSPVERTIYDIDYRIEAGTAKKPNRDREVANINEAMPFMIPAMQAREQMTMDFQPLNNFFRRWGKTVEMDVEGMLHQNPPPPQEDDTQQRMAEQEMQMEREKHQMDQQAQQAKLQMDQQKHGQDLGQDQQKHGQEMTQDQQAHRQEMTQTREKGLQDLRLDAMKAKAQAKAQATAARNRPKQGASK